MRCCPPDNLLYGEDTKELREHLQVCPWCREERAGSMDNPVFPVLQRKEVEKRRDVPEPGQLWSLKPDLGSWGPKKRYYFPPLVVIAEVFANSVAVLQSCGDMSLAGMDDLPFQTDLIGFSQPWNRYTLRIDDLDICYGLVADALDKELLSFERMKEQSVETGSLLWFFRQMEVETGYFFAAQAIPQLLSEHENTQDEITVDILEPLQGDLKKMKTQLLDLGLVLPHLPSSEASAIDLLLSVQPSDDLLPLAAADSGTASEYALSFTLNKGKIIKVTATGLHITSWLREGPLLHISGNIMEPVSDTFEVFFRLKVGKHFFDPIPGEYGIENNFFWALFQVDDTDMEKGECVVRIITDEI